MLIFGGGESAIFLEHKFYEVLDPITFLIVYFSVQFSSVAQSCLILCDPMNRSTPGLPVHHQLQEFTQTHVYSWGFSGGSDGKASTCNAGDLGSIPGSEGSPGEGNGNPLQHSCLENPMDGGA